MNEIWFNYKQTFDLSQYGFHLFFIAIYPQFDNINTLFKQLKIQIKP